MAAAIETITIVNKTGKIISSGRHLVDLLKEGHAVYKEKKASLRSDRVLKRPHPRTCEHDSSSQLISRSSKPSSHKHHHANHHPRSNRSGTGSLPGPTAKALTERNLQVLTSASDAFSPVSGPPAAVGVALDAIDLNLAYGDMPPNLASRYDLDPAWRAGNKERCAAALATRIEYLLDEAHVLHHTASSIISRLQAKPEDAAAVALTLAELSSLVSSLSPAALCSVKGAAPVAFALLASPEFLVGAGVAVGVTVVMFGGWKIIKHMRDARRDAALAWEAPGPNQSPATADRSIDVDEALVIDRELAGIESWRRGISPDFGDGTTLVDESVDEELISPEADRALRRSRRGESDSGRLSRRKATTATATQTATVIATSTGSAVSAYSRRDRDRAKSEAPAIGEAQLALPKARAAPPSAAASKDRSIVGRPRKRDLVLRAVLLRKSTPLQSAK